MRGIGVLENGFVFSEAELERGTPRFWWGRRKRAAFERVLAQYGVSQKDHREQDATEGTSSWLPSSGAGAAAYLVSEWAEKKAEAGSGFDTGGGRSDGGGSSDSGGGSSDSGGSSDGGGSSSGE